MAQAKQTKKASASPKVMDVKKSSGASPTSRQVIVENRSIAQDPMMAQISKLTNNISSTPEPATVPGEVGPVEHTEEVSGAPALTPAAKKVAIKLTHHAKEIEQPAPADTDQASDGPALPPSKKRIIIQPLSAGDEKTDTKQSAGESQTEATTQAKTKKAEPTIADLAKPDPLEGMTPSPAVAAEEESVVEPEEKTDTQHAKEDPSDKPTDSSKSDEEDKDAPAEESAADSKEKPVDSAPESEEASTSTVVTDIDDKDDKKKHKKTPTGGELTAEQQKAVEAEEYFLPITTAETRRLRKELLFATVFIIVVLIIWVDIMLDAELMKINGLKAVTNFFK